MIEGLSDWQNNNEYENETNIIIDGLDAVIRNCARRKDWRYA